MRYCVFLNSNVEKFFDTASSEGLWKLRDSISAFENPTRTLLRETKNEIRDYLLEHSDVFFPNSTGSSITYFNQARYLEGLHNPGETIKSLVGLKCLDTSICSQCGFQVIVTRHWLEVETRKWVDIFPYSVDRVSLEMFIETISQRTGLLVCRFCNVKKSVMKTYLNHKII